MPSSLPVDSTLYDILAVASREGTKLQGLPLFDYWARGKHPKTIRRVRREVVKRREQTFSIDWRKLLPEEFSDFPDHQLSRAGPVQMFPWLRNEITAISTTH